MRVPVSPGAQLEERPLTPPFQQINAPAEAFGAGVAQEIRRTGAVLGQAGDQLFQRSQQFEDQQDATAAQAAYLAATKQKGETLYNPNTGVAFRQGVNATGMTQDAMKQLEEIGRTTRDGLANDRQRVTFDKLWGSHSATEVTQMSRREATEARQAQGEVMRGMIANAQTDAAQHHNDPEAILAQAGLAERSSRAGNVGKPAELIEADATAARSGVLKTAVLARSAAGDVLGANAFFQQVKGRLNSPDLISLEDHLRLPVARETARGIVDRVTAAPTSVSGPIPDQVRQQAQAQGVEPKVALAIGQLESGLGTKADQPGSQYQGVFQMGTGAWAARGGTTAERPDPGAQVRFGVANIAHSQGVAQKVLGRKPEGWETYMVHQQGDAGGPALLRAEGSQPAIAVLASLPYYQARPGVAVQAVKGNGGWDGMTVEQFRDTWRSKYARAEAGVQPQRVAALDGRMTDASAPAFRAPDVDAWIEQVRQGAGGDPEVERLGIADARQRFNLWHSQTQVSRSALGRELKDVRAALADGRNVDMPEDRVRGLYPAEQADEIMGQLHEARLDGEVLGQVRFMGAAELSAAMAQAGAGLGPTPDGGTPSDVEGYRQRQVAYARLVKANKDRTDQLNRDPASYVTQAPAVMALHQALDPKRPETTVAYVQGSMAEQERLGVPEAKRRALPVAQAEALVERMTKLDPSQADIGAEMARMAQDFGVGLPGGGAWPAVFGDLVKAKLPGMYQVLPVVPDAAVRGELQNALAVSTKKGGVNVMREMGHKAHHYGNVR